MKQKTKNILTWIPSVLAAIIVTMSACMKLAGLPQLVEMYSRMGISGYMKILGAAELLFIILFLIRRTLKPGFLLLTAYFGGAIAVEFSHGNIFVFPALILTIIWIAAFLRDASIFRSFQKQSQTFPA